MEFITRAPEPTAVTLFELLTLLKLKMLPNLKKFADLLLKGSLSYNLDNKILTFLATLPSCVGQILDLAKHFDFFHEAGF